MKSFYIKAALICVVLLSAITLLYFKSNAVSYARHGRFERGLQRLKQIDTAFNEDVLKARFRLLNNYDGFAAQIEESETIMRQLFDAPLFIPPEGREELRVALLELSVLLKQKHGLLEDFKSQNSVLRNSQSYFPEAADQLIRRAGGDRDLEAGVNDLLRRVLVFSFTFDEELAPTVRDSMNRMRAWTVAHPQHAEAALTDSLLAQARVMVMRRPKVEALTRDLVSVPSSRQVELVATIYDNHFLLATETAHQYRLLLFACCVLLLAGVALAFGALQAANHRLEDRVAERTSELTRSTEILQGEIKERQRTQEALIQNEQRFRTLSTCSPVGIFETDAAGNCLYTNPRWQAMAGLTLEESLNGGWACAVHPDDVEGVMEEWRKVTAVGGSFIWEFRFQPPGGKVCWVRANSSPIRTNNGITGHVGTIEDVTERKHAEHERHQMEVQLRHAQKMESIGQLAAGIAHEINTPTQYIGDNIRFLKDAFNDLNDVLRLQGELVQSVKTQSITDKLVADAENAAKTADVEYLATEIPNAILQSLDGVERVAKIVRSMKEFSHPGTNEKVQLDLNRAIESTITVCRNEWKYVAEMVTEFDVNLPLVPCLPGEINQTVLNLIVNAAHAIADVVGDAANGKGAIKVSTRADGGWVEIRVRDTGTGIPEHARARIFDPFFTTKEVGKGTGQGLAIAHAVVVEKHGGTIAFETEMGRGATFIIRLPLTASSAASQLKAA